MNCYFINAAHKEYLLTIADKSCAERDGQLVIWKFERGLHNQFILFKERMVNALSGCLLEPENPDLGSIVIQDHVSKRQERWFYYPDQTIRNSKGLCLDVQGARFEDGTPVILWEVNGKEEQKWIPATVFVQKVKKGKKHHHKHHSKKEPKPEEKKEEQPAPAPAEEKKDSSDDENKKKGFFEKVADKISDALSSSSSSDEKEGDAPAEGGENPEGKKRKHRKHHSHSKDGEHKHRKHHSHSKDGEEKPQQ